MGNEQSASSSSSSNLYVAEAANIERAAHALHATSTAPTIAKLTAIAALRLALDDYEQLLRT